MSEGVALLRDFFATHTLHEGFNVSATATRTDGAPTERLPVGVSLIIDRDDRAQGNACIIELVALRARGRETTLELEFQRATALNGRCGPVL